MQCNRMVISLRAFIGWCAVSALSACGTVTGIPSHGGGKRFAVEQELISASARAALASIDVSRLAGRSVRIVFSSIGDEGSGNLSGGRLTIDRLLTGNYSSGPITQNQTNAVGITRSITSGSNFQSGLGLLTDGASGYRSEAFINPRDVEFLSSLVATRLILAGARVKANPAAKVDVLVLVLVDVFGTIRDRTDFLIYNRERLRARTAVELAGISPADGAVLLPPRRGAAEAVWDETYILWTGPIGTHRSLGPIEGLLMPATPSPEMPEAAGRRSGAWVETSPPPVAARSSRSSIGRPNLLPKPDTKPRTDPPFH